MHCRGSFLVTSFLVCVTGCGRTDLDSPAASPGGTASFSSVTGTSGTQATGGVTSAGGASATGGVTSTGGSTSASDGSASTNGLDTCSPDNDCTLCIWPTAPTSSDECAGSYCCAGITSTKRRCEANQAAWNLHCPNQSPEHLVCPCMGCLCNGQSCLPLRCIGGQCGVWC
jgi:hypothetical protein